MKQLIKQLTPPVLLNLFRASKKQPDANADEGIYWKGNYTSWSDATQNSTGYDAGLILERCKNALAKVRDGEAVYERDSVLFDKVQYSWPLLACLEKAGT